MRPLACFLTASVLAGALPALAENPGDYKVGNIPIAGGVASVEFPVAGAVAAEADVGLLSQGTYDEGNPFAYLSLWAPAGWLHYDGVRNLRLSAGFQETFYRAIPPLGLPSSREERGLLRARLQQPRGEAALYEVLQLDLRSFDDAAGKHHLVVRPRFRLGQGFNLDAARINSLVLYEEVAFRFSADGYEKRAFEFFRTFAGYTWTTRRGTFVSIGVLGQVTLNPAATRYDFLWGPVLAVSHRFRAAPPEVPETPAEVDLQ